MGNYNHLDELVHYGVKGMKWGVRKKRYTKNDSKKYESLSERERLSRAQNAGSKALTAYKKLDDEYSSKIDDAIKRNDWDAADKFDRKLNERFYEEVYKPLTKAGYDYVYRGGGSTGLSLQFGKELSKVTYDKYGCERFVDDFMITVGDMKVFRTDDEEF